MNPRRRVRVVLVRPENPANVGAVARVVRNTGLLGLRLVCPGDWRTLECWRSAWGAHEVLEQAGVFDDLAGALHGAAYVAALSGRAEGRAPLIDVREMASELAALDPEQDACLVFGPETTGLTSDELLLCGRATRIPSHPEQPSLNLSHAAMVACYEVYRAPLSRPPSTALLATHDQKEALLGLWLAGLRGVAALPRGDLRGLREWRRFFSRLDLTPRELGLLSHVARKMAARAAPAARPAGDLQGGDPHVS